MEEERKLMSLTKTNWELSQDAIEWRGAVGAVLPKPIFEWIKKSCVNAKEKAKKANYTLAGHIKEEYFIEEISKDFVKFINEHCLTHEIIKTIIKGSQMQVLSENKPFYIDSLWVNYQKKYEFNPPHKHSGLFSFVIFIKIPYDLKEEETYFKDVKKDTFSTQHTSKFAFLNTNYSGEIHCDILPVDKSFEGNIIFFRAAQLHQVFPFYTSDDYRITVSGNLRLKV
tara:strand:+ start:2129 stop:2806 length:678 start_codon:yes stop_codon:yes gene_type:complete